MAQKENNRKIRAVLAGGLVLGVGAVLTLAAWNSSEFATGTFQTGAFVLEGKTPDEVDFGQHASKNDAATLGFVLGATNMAPGDTVSAGFAIRLDATTTFNGVAVINTTTVSDSVTGLTQRVYTSATEECTGAAVKDVIASTALSVSSGDADNAINLAKGSQGNAGETVNLCFEVTAGEDLAQKHTSTAVWEIVASQEP